MCWNGQASTALAVIGVSSAVYVAVKKEPIALWLCLLYFSSMEVLQAVSYSVIDQCSDPLNQLMTLFGYLHITFQPFFINAVALYFIPLERAQKIAPWVYAVCFASALSMLVQLYPFEWAGSCHIGRTLCSDHLCTVRGQWHLAWLVPTNGLGNILWGMPIFGGGYPGYLIAAFIMPLLYGSWRFAVFSWIVGPWLAWQTTSNINEWPAVWCLFSIALCLIIIKSPLRTHLHVRKWI